MLLLIDTFSINKGRGYENPSLEIIVTERCSTGGCPLEEACEHCYLNQSVVSVAISYIISVYCEDYAGYFTVILSFLAFHFCSAYFIYLVSCTICDNIYLHRGWHTPCEMPRTSSSNHLMHWDMESSSKLSLKKTWKYVHTNLLKMKKNTWDPEGTYLCTILY
jgi:hypothetical protein